MRPVELHCLKGIDPPEEVSSADQGHEAFNDLFGSTTTTAGGLSVVSKGKHHHRALGREPVTKPSTRILRKLQALVAGDRDTMSTHGSASYR